MRSVRTDPASRQVTDDERDHVVDGLGVLPDDIRQA
jgi:hypothetical protein